MKQSVEQLTLPFHPELPVVVQFDAPEISSNAGALLLRQADDALGLTQAFAACLPDDRDPRKVEHPRHEQVCQRIFQIALGYEDCNDADRLRHDPVLKTACDRSPKDDKGLSSQSTLSRFENAYDSLTLRRLVRLFEKHYIDSLSPDQEVVILDIDSTDDPTHGGQQLSFFHGYYDHYMYHPLLLFDGETGQLITALLRPGKAHASSRTKLVLRRLIRRIRKRCPRAGIVVRADSGFCTPKILREIERLDEELGGVDYLLGIARNAVLQRCLQPTMEAARARQIGREKVVLFKSFEYSANSWERRRHVVGKAEYGFRGENPRFVLTSLNQFDPESLYRAYCERGQCENYIKDFKNALQADRLSCSTFGANFFRLLLHGVAYRLMLLLRREAAAISEFFGKAQFDTFRLRLLKVGVQVRESTRRILFRLPESFPDAKVFRELALRLVGLRASPT